ncbi:flap endonuclease GEN homolog 1 isoform X1 [Gopherus flavomarginatus]|uniref:flap endonuclease GEN homolog 1 isoform X1 n=2 Tax=Gopherus flavomarginatus TaxID=286002 RepID=UPI0021CC4B37|nr:flap endonuclease GEN homolog 1 isoform X1 [Gopherus flavomarginatus]
MGVTNLWQILEPVKEHVHLSSLRGKTLAVDLSLWVCEAQTVKKMIGVVTKPHLRNLFFRISSLTSMEIKLVFVMEGDAPKLKAETMSKRNELRYGSLKKPRAAKTGRSYFKSVLKECLEMLECLGLPWVQAAGEAEAMCAYLNANGYVDGCITDDGDAFLYGAQTVYRNFTMNAKDPHVDCYTMSSIKEKLCCDRESLIGLAILLGCDYLPKGVPGVGKEQALKLIATLRGQSLLQRFDQWKGQLQRGNASVLTVNKMIHCSVCHHPGSCKDHELSGCKLCGSVKSCEPHDSQYCCLCEWHCSERVKQTNAVEDNIRKKARGCEGFPFSEVIEEFLVNKNKLVRIMERQRPDLLSFQRLAFEKMEWTKHYACKKLLSLLTHYDMIKRKSGQTDTEQLQAIRIVRTRVKNGIPCFEIEWQKPEHYVTADDQPTESFVVTVEKEALFQAAYPDIVGFYKVEKLEVLERKQRSKKNKPKEKEHSNIDGNVADLLSVMNLQSTCESFPEQDSKSDFKTLPDNQMQEKSISKSNDSLLAADFSTVIVQLQNPVSTLPLTASPNTQYHSVLDGSLTLPAQFTQLPEASSSYVSSMIVDLQLSGIDWDGTSFSISPAHVDSACCSVSELGASNNCISQPCTLQHKTRENTKYSGATQSDEDSCISAEYLVPTPTDLVEQLQKLPLRERIFLKTSVQKDTALSLNVVQPKPLQLLKQIKETSIPETVSAYPSVQLSDTTKEIKMLSEKYLKVSSVQNYQEQYKKLGNLVQMEQKHPKHSCLKSVGLRSQAAEPLHSEGESVKLTKATDNCHIRKFCTQATWKTSIKKSVCHDRHSSSEDSDDGTMMDKNQIYRIKQRRQLNPAQMKENITKERGNGGSNLSTKWKERGANLKITSNNLSMQVSPKPASVVEANSFPSPILSFKRLDSCSSLQQSKNDDCDVWVDSPLPLSERLKLRLKSN